MRFEPLPEQGGGAQGHQTEGGTHWEADQWLMIMEMMRMTRANFFNVVFVFIGL